MPRMGHFLAGSSPENWVRLLHRYGGVSSAQLGRALAISAGVAALGPWGWLERLTGRWLMRRTQLRTAPLFVLGHWRSGTTFLHNLLAQDPALAAPTFLHGVVPWNLLGWMGPVRLALRLLLPPDRLVDRMTNSPDAPVEEGLALANMCPYSFYHVLYFPKRMRDVFRTGVLLAEPAAEAEWGRCLLHLTRKLTHVSGGRRLVLKDPANTGRIKALLRLFPQAQFIHVCRNPYDVYASTCHLYRSLLPEMALQEYSEEAIAPMVLDSYRQLMQSYLLERELIPPGNLTEVRFEDLERDPMTCLAKTYQALDLPGWENAEPHIRGHALGQTGYRRNTYRLTPTEAEAVRREWAFAFSSWGYDGAEL